MIKLSIIIRKISNLWCGLRWLSHGAPMIYYEGYTCGCCGKGWKRPFVIPEFQSCGHWWDTWGLCPEGEGCNKESKVSNKYSFVKGIEV